ncbi:hypothetical protein EVAR_38430_1 [Eumeta japonica]|uniref:Uncharacterized protein n=1 Tax=Eumeta variegata TaxID=151549 RepID=A0A4C1WY51_EUMVA|nr:hypothetical protein EVAR_38430_1 [Eumeta japonica]
MSVVHNATTILAFDHFASTGSATGTPPRFGAARCITAEPASVQKKNGCCYCTTLNEMFRFRLQFCKLRAVRRAIKLDAPEDFTRAIGLFFCVFELPELSLAERTFLEAILESPIFNDFKTTADLLRYRSVLATRHLPNRERAGRCGVPPQRFT